MSKKLEKEIKKILDKAESGDDKAQLMLAGLFKSGKGVPVLPQSDEAAVVWYQEAFNKGAKETQREVLLMRLADYCQNNPTNKEKFFLTPAAANKECDRLFARVLMEEIQGGKKNISEIFSDNNLSSLRSLCWDHVSSNTRSSLDMKKEVEHPDLRDIVNLGKRVEQNSENKLVSIRGVKR